MSTIKEAVAELYLLGMLQGAIFCFGFGLVPPAQSAYGPTPECAAPFAVYGLIGVLDFYLSLGIVAATCLAGHVRYQLNAANGMAGIAASKRRRLRLLMLAAVVFSMTSMGIALAITSNLVQVKSTVFACWTPAARVSCFASLGVVSLLCVYIYADLIKVALLDN